MARALEIDEVQEKALLIPRLTGQIALEVAERTARHGRELLTALVLGMVDLAARFQT